MTSTVRVESDEVERTALRVCVEKRMVFLELRPPRAIDLNAFIRREKASSRRE